MKVLGLDTAAAACSVALWADGSVLAGRAAAMERGHAEALMPMVVDVLAEAGCGFDDLELLAATVGPGAFTGLRVGLAAARGMALACGRTCVGVTTLEAVAAGVDAGERVERCLIAALQSRRAELYVQIFDTAGVASAPPVAVLPEALPGLVTAPALVVGDAAGEAVDALTGAGIDAAASTAPSTVEAGVVAGIAAMRWRIGAESLAPSPLYLRPPDAIRPRNAGRLRP